MLLYGRQIRWRSGSLEFVERILHGGADSGVAIVERNRLWCSHLSLLPLSPYLGGIAAYPGKALSKRSDQPRNIVSPFESMWGGSEQSFEQQHERTPVHVYRRIDKAIAARTPPV